MQVLDLVKESPLATPVAWIDQGPDFVRPDLLTLVQQDGLYK